MTTRERLVSWKRIARYLDRGERTVRRWAAEEGMPVHRAAGGKRGSVFAYPDELDQWLQHDRPARAENLSSGTSIAVFPFQSVNRDLPTVVDTLVSEVIGALSRLPDLRVIARTTADRMQAMAQTPLDAARSLEVDYLIEGALTPRHNDIEVLAKLCRTESGKVVWRESWRVAAADESSVPAQVAARCAGAVATHVLHKAPPQAAPVVLTGPPNDDYLQGRYLLNRMTLESLRKSAKAFDRVIAAAPDFAAAYASKVEALQLMTNFDLMPPAEVMPDAILALNRAIALDPDSPEVFASLGYLHSTYTYDWSAAESAFVRALSLNPNLVQAHQWYAEMLANIGRFEDGLAAIDAAKRLDPLNLAVDASRGHVLWLARRYDDLIPAMERVVDMEEDVPLPHILLFCGFFEQGLYPEALKVVERAIEKASSPQNFFMFSAVTRAMVDDPSAIEQLIGMLDAMSAEQYVPSFPFAILNVYRSDYDAAVTYLNRAADEKAWHVTMTGQAALFDPLRGHPGFEAFLARIGLADSAYRPAA